MRLGIMGGTFNPIHYGHLVAANEVWEAFALDRVVFVPAATPPHKDPAKLIDPQHRFMMAMLATVSHSNFMVSSIEIERPGTSYSVETIVELKEMYQVSRTAYFIMGVDAFLDIATWRQPDELLRSCHMIVTSRPGYNLQELASGPLERLSAAYPELAFEATEGKEHPFVPGFRVVGTPYQIFFQKIIGMDISSTCIRRRVEREQTITYLLPDSVNAYIRKHRLYR